MYKVKVQYTAKITGIIPVYVDDELSGEDLVAEAEALAIDKVNEELFGPSKMNGYSCGEYVTEGDCFEIVEVTGDDR